MQYSAGANEANVHLTGHLRDPCRYTCWHSEQEGTVFEGGRHPQFTLEGLKSQWQ